MKSVTLLKCFTFFFIIFLAAFHEVSVYPKKELPFFILFTAGLCSFTAMLALLTHQFPELMGVFAKAVSSMSLFAHFLMDQGEVNELWDNRFFNQQAKWLLFFLPYGNFSLQIIICHYILAMSWRNVLWVGMLLICCQGSSNATRYFKWNE